MNRSFASTLSLTALAVTLALFTAPATLRADTPSQATQRTLSVSGQGEVKGTPNQAQLSAGVVTSAKTAAAALATNTNAMNGVFATLKKAGVPDKAMQTSGFSVSPQYSSSSSSQQHVTGYQVSNSVFITVDNLGKLGATLDALVNSGANNIGEIAFGIRDPKPLLTQARAAAVQDAISRAQTYAKAAGVQLGPIISIQDSGSDYARPMAMAGMMRASAPAPIAAGEQSVSASVTITWAIR